MKPFLFVLALAALAAAAIPLPATTTPPPRIFIHTTVEAGPLDIFVPTDGWAYVRLGSSPWIGPLTSAQLNAIPDDQQEATAGVTFCVSALAMGTHGSTMMITKQVEILCTAPTLEGAVAKAHAQILEATGPGWAVTPCPTASPTSQACEPVDGPELDCLVGLRKAA